MHNGAGVKGDVHFMFYTSLQRLFKQNKPQCHIIFINFVILHMFHPKANIARKQDLYEDMIDHEYMIFHIFTCNKIFATKGFNSLWCLVRITVQN